MLIFPNIFVIHFSFKNLYSHQLNGQFASTRKRITNVALATGRIQVDAKRFAEQAGLTDFVADGMDTRLSE